MKYIRENNVIKTWNNKAWAIILNVAFFLSILLMCDIKYEVSDDFIMSTVISGAYGNGYNPHLMFINIIWGYILLPFYYLMPKISWYLIAQLLVCLFSFILISYMLLEKLERPVAILFIIILLTFFADDAYILVQFTKTAMIAVVGGGSTFLWALFNERKKRLQISSACLVIVGTLIRFNVIYIAGGFFLIILVAEFCKLMKEKKWAFCGRVVFWGGMLITVAVFMNWLDGYIYNQDEEYSYYRAYSEARASIVDSEDYGYEAYEEKLREIGVSENDYKMMRSWNFADNTIFSKEILEQIGDIIREYKRELGVSKEKILEDIQFRGILVYPICLVCMALLLAAIVLLRKEWMTYMGIMLLAGFYIVYFFMTGRTVYRVEYGIFFSAFVVMMYFWKKKAKDFGQNIESKKGCAILILICLVIEGLLYIPDRTYLDNTKDSRKGYIEKFFFESWNYDARKYRKIVNKGEKSDDLIKEVNDHKENFYFMDFETTIQILYYDWNPFYTLPESFYDNILYFAGITTNFPDCNKILQERSIEEPLKDLVQEGVYLIDSKSKTLDLKIAFLQEHYYPEARAELYKEINGYQIWKIYEG